LAKTNRPAANRKSSASLTQVSGGGREERADVDQVQVHFRTLLAVVANEKPSHLALVILLFGPAPRN